jgi:hypothetical protein
LLYHGDFEAARNQLEQAISYGAEDVFSGEEEGVLTGVEMNEAGNTLPRHLTLTMMHLGNTSSAMLCCDNEEEVIPRLFEILKGCIGWEISRIGRSRR